VKIRLIVPILFILFILTPRGWVFAYEVIHPYEEFGDLTAHFEEEQYQVSVSDLAYSISEFFHAKMFGFTDKTRRPDSGNYLELFQSRDSALIIYHDCYEGACQKTPILEFSCRVEGLICRQPQILFKGEELSLQEFLRRGDFNLTQTPLR